MSDPFNNFMAPPVVANQNQAVNAKTTTTIGEALPAASVNNSASADTVDLSSKKEKKGPIKTVNNAIAGIKKFFASVKTYGGGTAKGVATGAVAGSFVFTLASAINHFTGEKAKKLPGKVLGIGTAVVALGTTLWKSSLNLNEQKSDIEHRYQGHKK